MVVASLLIGLLLSACGDLVGGPPGPESVNREGESVTITDRTGKRWEVGNAQKYGLRPGGFQFGLGPKAIRPIVNPQMALPGDNGYPSNSLSALVMGVDLNGIERAYALGVMSRHEVANEVFGEAHVAVAY
jgi:hypothetical protein